MINNKSIRISLLLALSWIIFIAFKPILKQSNVNVYNPQMVEIKGGTFIMGQKNGEGDEKPEHLVELKDFLIGKYEVTVAEYKDFCKETQREMPPEPEWGWIADHPIMNTSWNDAIAYINWLNGQTDEHYRLPTEAEFEYVIRNGGEPGIYPWGDGLPENENIADESLKEATSSNRIWNNYQDGFAYTAPVGSFNPNRLGIHDINGNIWEWCSDWYDKFSEVKAINPKGPGSGTYKVGRGGSYDSDPWHSRTASRAFVKPEFRKPGFRLAKYK
jgi:formylglycine-generating enzyme required for sulfatase activity